MKDLMDIFTHRLQEKIYAELKDEWREENFQRLKEPLYKGRIPDPDGHARLKGKCGDTMEIYLKFEGERVEKASYITDGCGSSNLCGSLAAELSLGKTPDELLDVTGEAIIDKLGGIPAVEEHCAYLAAETLQEALSDFMIKKTTGKKKCETKVGPVGSSDVSIQDPI
ncbi:MAG: iron-sulfur cluster assembly scaffold protein [Deltaproteobacteria bacterium]|nr:iron-sulfur cluster assembly scaffold protein [Deltaproteobacteria bacterium]